MLLARADSGASLLRFEPVELLPLVEDVLAQTSVLAEHQQLELEAELARAPICVQGDSRSSAHFFVILIDNAVKYAP